MINNLLPNHETYTLEEIKPQNTHEITHNGANYTHIPETEYFYNTENPLETYSFLKLLKKISPETYRSMSLKYNFPEPLRLVGLSSRIRIFRAVQLHFVTPPITEYITETITPALQYLTERAAKQRDIRTQYNAARWAIKQKHGEYLTYSENEITGETEVIHNEKEIDNLAAALFNYCGVAPDFDEKEYKMQGTSIHRITPTSEGITIEIGNPHTINARFNAGITEINTQIQNRIRDNKPLEPAPLKRAGMSVFYSYNNWFLSISSSYHMRVNAVYDDYIENKINPLERKKIKMPILEEPENILPPQKIQIPYADFIKTEISAAQYQQRKNNGYNVLYAACIQKAKRLPQEENRFTTKQLDNVGLNSKSLQSALKPENNILRRVAWGKYEFTADFWEAIQQ